MTIDHQIIYETLQYDIDTEATKVSALSSNKFNKYEYLTGEEIIPSNQKQMRQQAKFTQFPLGKTFEKEIKTIEDQTEKQIKATQNQGQVKTIKKYTYDDEDSPLISKQKEIFSKLADNKLDEIAQLDKKVSLYDLLYRYKSKTLNQKCDKYDNTLNLIDKIKKVEIKLAESENNHLRFKSILGEVKQGNNKKSSKEQKNA